MYWHFDVNFDGKLFSSTKEKKPLNLNLRLSTLDKHLYFGSLIRQTTTTDL